MNTTTTTTDTKSNGKAAKAAETASYPVEHIAIGRLRPSPTQPRKTFTGIDELAEDMKLRILSPLIVRAHGAENFEIVDGERRYRAAKKAGIAALPCSVRALTDAQVVEIQLVSQGQRQDLHPLEEADTYAILQSKFGYSVDDIAAKVGKSTATIYARLKLAVLCKPAREAFLEEKFGLSIALLIAKVADPSKQADALKQVLTEGDKPGPSVMTTEEVRDLIVREYALVLKDASFDRADATLIASAGACSSCPKRTGANPALFSDLESKDDLCTDAKCFQAKKDADWARKTDDAKRKGLKVLTDDEAKKVFVNGSYVASSAAFVDLDARNFDDPKCRTNKAILGSKAADVEVVIARDADGNTHKLVAKKAFAAVAPIKPDTLAEDEREKKRAKAEREKQKAKEVAHQARMANVADLAARREPTDALWRAIAAAVADNNWRAREVCKRRAIAVGEKENASGVLKAAIAKMTGAEARGLCVEFLAGTTGTVTDHLKAFEAALGGGAKPKAKVKLKAKPIAKKKKGKR